MNCEVCNRGDADVLVVLADEPFIVCGGCAEVADREVCA